MLRNDGSKKWIFEEYLNLSEMQFRFKDKETGQTMRLFYLYFVWKK